VAWRKRNGGGDNGKYRKKIMNGGENEKVSMK
jgi:hypothetical protein